MSSFPVHFDFNFRESSLSHIFTLNSSLIFSLKVIMKLLSLSIRDLLFRACPTPNFTNCLLSTNIFKKEKKCAAVPSTPHNARFTNLLQFRSSSNVQHLPHFHDTKECWLLPAASCRCCSAGQRYRSEVLKRLAIPSFSCVDSGNQLSLIMKTCNIRHNNCGGRVVNVGIETDSRVKEADRRVCAADLDQVGSESSERGLQQHGWFSPTGQEK